MHAAFQLFLGIWLGTLSLPDAKLPFNFEMVEKNGSKQMIIYNGDERIVCDEVQAEGDSLFVRLPIFDSEFRVAVQGKELNGFWINHGRKGHPRIPFHAIAGESKRFNAAKTPSVNVSGRWEVWFESGTKDSSLAIGVFKQHEDKVTGTFLTETGDHRYLEGIVSGDSLLLSVFDGTHAWLYQTKVVGDVMTGYMWSGAHYKGPMNGKRNPQIQLRNPESIAHFEGPLQFAFLSSDSVQVNISDERYRNKVTIVQILGTWCPNCMDETAFLSDYYNKHQSEGIEMIGLCFERSADYTVAVKNIKRLQSRYDLKYPLLYAGVANKDSVMQKLPGLKNFISFPSTLFVNREGKVVKVHTGFSGPATGVEYEKYSIEFINTLERLIK